MTSSDAGVRAQLARALQWEGAHVGFERAFDGIPREKRGVLAAGFEHSLWQLLEHMRLAQKDLLAFCGRRYVHALKWPDDYWPTEPAPDTNGSWTNSLKSFKTDRRRLARLVRDPKVNLLARVPTGKPGQTYLRAILLVIDHNAYHLGQVIDVRKALGIW